MLIQTRKMARYVATLLLLVLSYSAVCGAAGLGEQVICFSGSGHVAVEFSQGRKCTEFVDEHPYRPMPAGIEGRTFAHCGSCLDVRLPSAQATKTNEFYERAWLTQLPTPGDVVILATKPVAVDGEIVLLQPLVSAFPLFSTIRARRTVVIQV